MQQSPLDADLDAVLIVEDAIDELMQCEAGDGELGEEEVDRILMAAGTAEKGSERRADAIEASEERGGRGAGGGRGGGAWKIGAEGLFGEERGGGGVAADKLRIVILGLVLCRGFVRTEAA